MKLKKILAVTKNFLLDILFPSFCINCGQEGSYLCEDCQGLAPILEYRHCLCKNPVRMYKKGKCKRCQSKKLNGLYFALPYQNPLVKSLIRRFKYEPYLAKNLAKPLSSLIIAHFQFLDKSPNFANFVLVPVPLGKKKLKQRGFNQSEEIGKELSKIFKILLLCDVLFKTKETLPQVELSEKEREKNIKGVFLVKNENEIKGKKILLIDDVYTTGSTMEECARVLKEAGAKEVWGVVIARG